MSTQGARRLERVLVVGGSHGIGRATVMRLAADGVQVAIGYSSDDAGATATADRAALLGPRPATVKGDVASEGAAIVAAAQEHIGGLEGIVVTAGVATLGRTLATTYEDHRRALDVQVWGLLEVVRAAADSLAAADGAVVAVSGITADRYAKYYGPIGPSKGALETLVRYLAAELGPRQVRVNAVSPCLIADEDHDKPAEVEPFWEQVRQRDAAAAAGLTRRHRRQHRRPARSRPRVRHGPGPRRRWRLHAVVVTERPRELLRLPVLGGE